MKRRPTHPPAKRAVKRNQDAGLFYFSRSNAVYTSVGRGYELADGTTLVVVGDRACYLDPDGDSRPDYWHVVAVAADGRTRRLSHPIVHDQAYGFDSEHQADSWARAIANGGGLANL